MTGRPEASGSVFVTASSGAPQGEVEQLLIQSGLSLVRWSDLPLGPLGESLVDALGRCIALIAVLADGTRPSAGALIDIGAALGRGLPIILVAKNPRTKNRLPPVLDDLPFIHLGSD